MFLTLEMKFLLTLALLCVLNFSQVTTKKLSSFLGVNWLNLNLGVSSSDQCRHSTYRWFGRSTALPECVKQHSSATSSGHERMEECPRFYRQRTQVDGHASRVGFVRGQRADFRKAELRQHNWKAEPKRWPLSGVVRALRLEVFPESRISGRDRWNICLNFRVFSPTLDVFRLRRAMRCHVKSREDDAAIFEENLGGKKSRLDVDFFWRRRSFSELVGLWLYLWGEAFGAEMGHDGVQERKGNRSHCEIFRLPDLPWLSEV